MHIVVTGMSHNNIFDWLEGAEIFVHGKLNHLLLVLSRCEVPPASRGRRGDVVTA